MPTVEFLDAGKKIDCGQYANLRKVALLHDVEVYKGFDQIANCRGNGLCGTCVMEIVEGIENLYMLGHDAQGTGFAAEVIGDAAMRFDRMLT